MLPFILLLSSTVSAAPCITAGPACTEWISLKSPTAHSLVYRTHALVTRNEKITRATIVVHGQGRNADDYFRTGIAAAFLAGALDDTVVIAPRFASNDGRTCRDTLAEGEINWRCSGDSWRSGASATNNEHLTSYHFADTVLKLLANKGVFPNLKKIVFTGHSAGGQFVARYAMANQVHEGLNVPVTYVVSNPSSYAYLDATRPVSGGSEFRSFGEGRNCTTYNRWPYGLADRTGYAATLTDEQLKKQLTSRPVVYLLGELDTLPIAGFDTSCPAAAQGSSRLERGKAFAAHVNRNGAKHSLTIVPLCGHNNRCIYTADQALPILFPT
jgi:pimeloyl-ACP methyl ester carboxylesterase